MVSRQAMVSVPPLRGRIGGGWCHRTGNYSLYWCLSKKGSAISTRKSTEILIKSKENMSKIIRDDQSVMTNLWCSVLSVFYFRPASIAVGRWALYVHWYCYSVVRCGVPSLRQGHKSKKNTDSTDLTRIGLSRIFFWYYWANDSWIWGWFIGICECWSTPFPGGIAIVTPHIDNSPHLASPVGEGQILLASTLLRYTE